jgi:hypothetical protein
MPGLLSERRTRERACSDRGDGLGGFDAFDELRAGKLSRAIDRLVYELYGLSEEEIRLVEGRRSSGEHGAGSRSHGLRCEAIRQVVMSKSKQAALIPPERIERSILLVRGQRVLLDMDLAVLYGVDTKVLNQAVRRNHGDRGARLASR